MKPDAKTLNLFNDRVGNSMRVVTPGISVIAVIAVRPHMARRRITGISIYDASLVHASSGTPISILEVTVVTLLPLFCQAVAAHAGGYTGRQV